MRSQIRNGIRPDDWLLWQTPSHISAAEPGTKLEVNVIFTTPNGTMEALKMAAQLAGGLDAGVKLLAPQVVPYQLELTRPPVCIRSLQARYRGLAAKAPVDACVQVLLCRDKLSALRRVLKPGSLVVIGGGSGWWPTEGKKLIGKLREDGHHVLLTRGG